MFAPKKILVPTDFSEYSDKALQTAIDLAKQYTAKIWLVHVVNIVRQCSIDYCMDPEMVNDIETAGIKSAKEMFQKELERVPDAKTMDIIVDVRKGTPSEEILNVQEKEAVDLIVIASHGTTGLLHYLLGSVADKITKAAKCPVLLVRAA